MGHQCYYIGTTTEAASLLSSKLKFAFKDADFCGLGGTIQFKKDVPYGYDRQTKTYRDKVEGNSDMIYFVAEGDRGELHDCLRDFFSAGWKILDLNEMATEVYLPAYREQKFRKTFENEYVRICS